MTFDGQRWSNAEEDRIELVAYVSRWPACFAEEAAAIRGALGAAGCDLRIEHFGSTAIPGIAAKPIIDMLLIPPTDADWRDFVAPLETLDYVYWARNRAPTACFSSRACHRTA